MKRVYDRVREASEKPEISLLIWEDYLAAPVINQFRTDTGVRVKVTEVDNSEQLRQRLAATPAAFDVVVADEQSMKELIELRLLSELDKEKLGAKAAQVEPFLDLACDKGTCFTIPYLWGLTVLVGRSELFSQSEPSWAMIWREDLKIALLDEPADLMWMALLALGYDPAEAIESQIDEAAARLAERFPDITRSMKDQQTILDLLEAGEVDLAVSYNGDALTRMADAPGIEIVVPREGAPLWLDSFAISRDTTNVELAHRFIDYMTKPETSALSATGLNYASPNRAALPMMDKAVLNNRVLYPGADLIKKCSFVRFPPETEKYVKAVMLRLISESRSRSFTADWAEQEASNTEDGGPE